MKKLVYSYILIFLLVGLVGCGGGSDSSSGNAGGSGGGNTTASVNAGLDKTVNELLGTSVTAIGFPEGGSYAWTQVAGPILPEFPATEGAVSFAAPVTKVEQLVSLRVEYTSSDGQVVSDTVNITVKPINRDPVAIASLKSPTTDPVPPDTTVVLDGSASFDQDPDGVIKTYTWTQGEGTPLVSQLNGSTSPEFHFVAPQVTTATIFPFRLTIADDEGGTAVYDISVNVDPSLTVVAVEAGADVVTNEQQPITLTAVGQPAGGVYKWSQLSGDSLTNFPAEGASVELTSLPTKSVKNYEFRVEYTSPAGFVAYDQLRVIVNPVNKKPVAIVRVLTPALLPANADELVTLDGSASTDSDGAISEYHWSQVSGPVNITPQSSSDPKLFKFKAPAQEHPASYVYRLTVIDDEQGEGSYDIEIEVGGTTAVIVADAGVNQLVDEFSRVTLDGTASRSTVSVVTCSWRLVSGPTVSFTTPDQCVASFVAPNVDVNTDLNFELKVTNSDGDEATDVTTVTVKPIALGKVTDSGQVTCYNQNQAIPCGDTTYPRQDAEFGRDSVSQFLDKVGTGEVGFDYTKLDANGDEIADDASNYACVRDNFTGLIWEIKSISNVNVPNTSLRDNKNTYVWHYPAGSTGGESGTGTGAGVLCPSTADCGLETFVKDVNEAVYCGGSNWRVPTMVELQSIVNYAKGSDEGAVDSTIFNDLPDINIKGNLYYWASETSADGGGKLSAWVMNFANGNDNSLPKPQDTFVRLVREP